MEQVSAKDVFFTEDQLVVKQEEAALLHFALSDDSSQLTGVDQVRAALQDVGSLQQHQEALTRSREYQISNQHSSISLEKKQMTYN